MITDGQPTRTEARPAGEAIATVPTRDRLLDAALSLFAERGFQGTTVGDIEAAAGLTPRSGGLYKHFSSKEEVLHAAVERHGRDLGQLEQMVGLLPLGDLRAELTLLIRLSLQELARERELIRIVFREGDRFPELRDAMRERVVARGHRSAAAWVRWKVETGELPECDPDAVAAVALGAVVNYRIEEIFFGQSAGDIDEERLVTTLVDLCLAFAGLADGEGDDS